MKMQRLLVTALALSLLATACGGGDTTSDTDTDAAVATEDVATETAAPADEEPTADAEPTEAAAASTEDATEDAEPASTPQDFGEPLRVILSSQYNLPLIGADAAEYLGLYDEIGLEVELIESQDVVPALASNDADIAIASPNRFIGGILSGLEATIVGPTVDVWDQLFIVSAASEAQSLQEFEGGRIGVSGFGSAGHYSAVKVAEEIGLTEEDYEIVTLGNLDGLIAGLSNGTIDAFAWSAQAALTLEQQGDGRILGHVAEVIGPNPLDVITVNNATIEEQPEAVRAFCDAYYEAQQTFKEDEALATQVFIEEWDFDEAIAGDMVAAGAPYLSTDDAMTEEMFVNMADATEFTIEDVGEVEPAAVEEMYTPCSEL